VNSPAQPTARRRPTAALAEAANHPELRRDEGPRRRPVSPALLLGGILALALPLRLFFLGGQSLWWDEGNSVSYALGSWRELANILLHVETNMSVYHVLLRLWLSLGSSEFAARGLSVLFSVATVPIVYALGARMFGVRVGLTAALLLAVNAFHVEYAQEARSYSLVVFLVSLSSLCFLTGLQQPSRHSWTAYVVASALAVYSHVFAIFVPVAHGASLLFLRRRHVPWRAVLTSASAIGVLILPFVLVVVGNDRGEISWIPRPTLDAPFRVLLKLAGAVDVVPAEQNILLAPPEVARRLLFVVYLALCAAALVQAGTLWIRRQAPLEAWYRGFLASWLLVPISLAFVASAVKPIFVAYYLIVCLPPLVLLAALGIDGITRRWVRVSALVLTVGLAVSTVLVYYRYAAKEDWRGATRYVVAHAQPGDVMTFYTGNRRLFAYYRDRVGGSAARAPRIVDSDDLLGELGTPSSPSGRIWLVLCHATIGTPSPSGRADTTGVEQLRASLARNHPLVEQASFTAIQVLLYGPGRSASLPR
jgi:mannosyltransferase